MRYYSYIEPLDDNDLFYKIGHREVRVSEQNIKEQYWPYWYQKMCDKFGKEHVDKNYNFEHCLSDWIVVNWAKEVTEKTCNK